MSLLQRSAMSSSFKQSIWILLVWLAAALPVGARADSPPKGVSDDAWTRLSAPIDGCATEAEASGKYGYVSAERRRWRELYNRQYRERGLEFWMRYPDDERRWKWLYMTVTENAPNYGRSDTHRAGAWSAECAYSDWKEWTRNFVALRAAFLHSGPGWVTGEERRVFLFRSLLDKISHTAFEVDQGLPVDANALADDIIDFCANEAAANPRMIGSLSAAYLKSVGGDHRLEYSFIAAMKAIPSLAFFADGYEQVARLRGRPLEMRLLGLDGAEINLSQLRGKVVLVDFWSTNCSGCVEGMREIKQVYDRYRSRGFAVVGVAFDEEKERPKIQKIVRDAGIDWPQSIQGKLSQSPLAKQFGFVYVPWTFLLDKKGMLVTTDLRGAKLEQEVIRLIRLPTDDKAVQP